MYKSDVLKHFDENGAAVARAIRVTRSAVKQWPDVVPLDKAYRLQVATKGKLRVNNSLYPELTESLRA